MLVNRMIFAIVLIAASPSFASYLCQSIFTDSYLTKEITKFGVVYKDKPYTPEELLQFHITKKQLDRVLSDSKDQGEYVRHILDAVEFYDYEHTAPKFFEKLFNETKGQVDFKRLYKPTFSWGANPFEMFLETRGYLKTSRPPVTPDLLLNIHKQIMKGGVEGVPEAQLGQWRNEHWVGRATRSTALIKSEVDAIQNNKYLYFEEKRSYEVSKNIGVWSRIKVWLKKLGTYLDSTEKETKIEGNINYPNVLESKQTTIDLIRQSHPELHSEIMNLRDQWAKRASPDIRKLTASVEARFTKALVENRFQEFNIDRSNLGIVEIGVNEHLYIDLVANFQRDLVAIHPLFNGNGRSTRLFMNYLLTKEGLPPVRLLDPILDVQTSREAWTEYVHKGVLNTAQLYADILYRLQNKLPIENSPELLYPGLAETVTISLKKQGSTKSLENYTRIKVDGNQFNAFVKTLVKMHPELKAELENNRLPTLNKLSDLFTEFYKSKNLRYLHEKDGEKEISLKLIEPEFIENFGILTSRNPVLWRAKMERWYSDLLIWRGLSNQVKEYSVEDLLAYFKTPTAHMASNLATSKLRFGTNLINVIKEDFYTYNAELITGDVLQMAIDHHRSGPRYGQSYGYSTSKREVVGKAFAMGAMVIGEYGKHKDPALQDKLKSRINVASYRAQKDIDLGRLKPFEESFSYTYGRQAEVMGIGGTDPDAVVLIQRINSRGNVIETYFRNPLRPSEILIIKGRYVPTEGPLDPSRILSKHEL